MRGLKDKVAIVTGGASGIGEATCRRFVEEGAKVAIGDLNGAGAQKLADELGSSALAVQFDAEDVVSVERLVAQTVAKFGKLDFMFVNHAMMGPEWISRDTNPVDTEFEVFDRMFAVNARGFMACVKYGVPHMLKGGGGAIVCTSAGGAAHGDLSNFCYSASKAAINIMAQYVATTYGKQGIRCNAVSPGLILTPGALKNVTKPMQDIMLNHVVTPRHGQPEDVAAMAVYLCSSDAEYVTGQVINVDGGTTMHAAHYGDMISGKFNWDK